MRVLIIEDEVLIAMLIEDMLADLGCIVVGIVSTLDDALTRIAALGFDAAILDVNLNGAESYPAARALARHHVPFLFSTGYGHRGISASFRGVPILAKPFESADLERGLAAAIA